MPATKAELKAIAKYQKENIQALKLKFNRKTEASLLEWIEAQPNKQGYIKDLIRKDMEKHQR